MMDGGTTECAAKVRDTCYIIISAIDLDITESPDSTYNNDMSSLCAVLSRLKPGERSMVNLAMDLLKGVFADSRSEPDEELVSKGGR